MAHARTSPRWPILVAGAGVPSLAFCLAIARAAGPAVEVRVLDPALGSGRADGRAYALSPGALRMLQGLGLKVELAPYLQPIARMTITDGRAPDRVRQTYLRFEASPEAPLGSMVEADVLARTLKAACRDAGVAFGSDAVEAVAVTGEGRLSVELSRGGRLGPALLVAADGARSRLRDEAGIAWVGRPFAQVGIVTTLAHPRDHRGEAVQHFLPGGPFAILPLPPSSDGSFRSSIVWTEERDEGRRVLSLPPREQLAELRRRFAGAFGDPDLLAPLRSFPLGQGLARRFVGQRLALLGDAAHEIHPLAGQGLNLGLADAAALAEAVVDAVRLGLDPGRAETLLAYERARRFDAVALAGTTGALNALFSTDRTPLRFLRDLGLGAVDRSRALKAFFIGQAAGATGRAPRLMRGEAL